MYGVPVDLSQASPERSEKGAQGLKITWRLFYYMYRVLSTSKRNGFLDDHS